MTFLPSKDSVLSAAENLGDIAKEALHQRDEARRERDAAVKRVAELEAELEHVRGIVFDVDLRDAVQSLLKSEMSAGDLRRALGELVR